MIDTVAFIPQAMKPYLYQGDADGKRGIHADRYEFLVNRLLRNRLEAGDIYVSDSLRFRSLEEGLIPKDAWNLDRLCILQDIDAISRILSSVRQASATLRYSVPANTRCDGG
jgi:hypothetical protein